MGSQRSDISSYYQPIIKAVENFRGPEAYIKDVIHRVSLHEAKVDMNQKIETIEDVVILLSKVAVNQV